MLIDTHCHLHFPDFDADRDDAMKRAREAGVAHFVDVGTGPDTNEKARALAARHKDMSFTAGLHPHSAHEADEPYLASVEVFAREHRPVAIGEVGLDYFKSPAPADVQKKVLVRMVRLALSLDLPLVVHSRDAFADTLALLKTEGGGKARGVFHCFSYGPSEMEEAVKIGFHVSFAGVVTFKNASRLAETAAAAPLERILVETDAPYLAPEPHRGKRNEPAFVANTAAFIAAKRGIDPAALADATTRSAVALFRLPVTR